MKKIKKTIYMSGNNSRLVYAEWMLGPNDLRYNWHDIMTSDDTIRVIHLHKGASRVA